MNRSERWALARAAAALLSQLRFDLEDEGTPEEKKLAIETHEQACDLTKLFEMPEDMVAPKGGLSPEVIEWSRKGVAMNPDDDKTETPSQSPPKRPGPGYTRERVSKLFNTHELPPEVGEKFRMIKRAFEELALFVVEKTPSSPHQTISINKIIEAKDAACLGYITSVMPDED